MSEQHGPQPQPHAHHTHGIDMHAFHALLDATPPFSGSQGEDATRWLLRIDRIAVPLACNDESKLAVAMSKLEDGAYRFSESTVFHTWDSFKAGLTLRYAEDRHLIKQRLAKCKQTVGESVQDYIDRHKLLCIRAGLTDRDGEEILTKFLKGLTSTLYDRVMVSCPTSYDEAVSKAIYFAKLMAKTGRSSLLNETTENGKPRSTFHTSHASRPPEHRPRFEGKPNNYGTQRYQGPPHQGRPEAHGMGKLTQEFGDKLKLNMRASTQRHSNNSHPPYHVMTRSTSCPRPLIPSMWEDSTSDEDEIATDVHYNQRLFPPHYAQTMDGRDDGDMGTKDNSLNEGIDTAAALMSESFITNDIKYSPTPAVSMRRAYEHNPVPHIYERMEIDNMPHQAKPHTRTPFSPATHHDNPPQGPRVIRKTGRPHVTFADGQANNIFPPPPPTPGFPSSSLGKNESRLLDELYSSLRVRNLGLEDLSSLRIDRVLAALAQRIKSAISDPDRPTHSVNFVDAKPNRRPSFPRSVYYDVLQAVMQIAGVSTPVIVDTGSTTCAVSLTFCEQLGLASAIQPCDTLYVNADGVECLSPGMLPNLQIECGGRIQKVEALVIPGAAYNALVGIDFLSPIQASINFPEKCLEFNITKNLRGRVPVTCTTTTVRTPTTIHVLQPAYHMDLDSPLYPTAELHNTEPHPNAARLIISHTFNKGLIHLKEKGLISDVYYSAFTTMADPAFGTFVEMDRNFWNNSLKDYGPTNVEHEWVNSKTDGLIPSYLGVIMTDAKQRMLNGSDENMTPDQLSDKLSEIRRLMMFEEEQDIKMERSESVDSDYSQKSLISPEGDKADHIAEQYYHRTGQAVRLTRPLSTPFASRSAQTAGMKYANCPPSPRPGVPVKSQQLLVRFQGNRAHPHAIMTKGLSSRAQPPPFTLPCGKVDIGTHLSHEQQHAIFDLITKHEELFSLSNTDLGCISTVMHEIEVLPDQKPIKSPPYRLSYHEKELMNTEIEKMLTAGIIEPCISNWASPCLLVPKKTPGQWRFCVDMRKLNAVTINKDAYPMPHITDTLDLLSNCPYISSMDATQSFYQIFVHPNSRDKTAFVANGNMWRFVRMPMGCSGSVATMQRFMSSVLEPILDRAAAVWIDDVVVYSKTFNQHLLDLEETFTLLQRSGIKMSMKKSSFCPADIRVLGHKITHGGIISTDENKVQSIRDFPIPTTVKQVRSWLGLCTWYKRFVRSFSSIAEPLTQLLRKDQPFVWGIKQQIAFDTMKMHLTSEPILRMPREDLPFILYTDASSLAIGAILAQIHPETGLEHVVAYGSRRLQGGELNYSVTECEALAVVHFIKHFRKYLHGPKPFEVITDHSALTSLLGAMSKSKDIDGRLARWQLKLQQYNFTVRYRPGTLHSNVDALTRQDADCPAPPPPKQIMCLQPMHLQSRLEKQVQTAREVLHRVKLENVTEDELAVPEVDQLDMKLQLKDPHVLGCKEYLLTNSKQRSGLSADEKERLKACFPNLEGFEDLVKPALSPASSAQSEDDTFAEQVTPTHPSPTEIPDPPHVLDQLEDSIHMHQHIRDMQHAALQVHQKALDKILQVGTGYFADHNHTVSPTTQEITRPASYEGVLKRIKAHSLPWVFSLLQMAATHRPVNLPLNSTHPECAIICHYLVAAEWVRKDIDQSIKLVQGVLNMHYGTPQEHIVGVINVPEDHHDGSLSSICIQFDHPDHSAAFMKQVKRRPAIRSLCYEAFPVTFSYLPGAPSRGRDLLRVAFSELIRVAPFTNPVMMADENGATIKIGVFNNLPLVLNVPLAEAAFEFYEESLQQNPDPDQAPPPSPASLTSTDSDSSAATTASVQQKEDDDKAFQATVAFLCHTNIPGLPSKFLEAMVKVETAPCMAFTSGDNCSACTHNSNTIDTAHAVDSHLAHDSMPSTDTFPSSDPEMDSNTDNKLDSDTLDRSTTSHLDPPFIISVEGLIGSGKTTALTLARQELENSGWKVQLEPLIEFEPDIIPLFYANPVLQSMNIQSAALRSYGQVTLAPFLIVERSPEACMHVFAQNLLNRHLISPDQYEELSLLRNSITWSPDAFIHVNTPINTSMARIHHRNRDGEHHIPTHLLEHHDHLYANMYHDLHKPVHIIDGSLSPDEVARNLVSTILSILDSTHGQFDPLHIGAPPVPTIAMMNRPGQSALNQEQEGNPSTKRRRTEAGPSSTKRTYSATQQTDEYYDPTVGPSDNPPDQPPTHRKRRLFPKHLMSPSLESTHSDPIITRVVTPNHQLQPPVHLTPQLLHMQPTHMISPFNRQPIRTSHSFPSWDDSLSENDTPPSEDLELGFSSDDLQHIAQNDHNFPPIHRRMEPGHNTAGPSNQECSLRNALSGDTDELGVLDVVDDIPLIEYLTTGSLPNTIGMTNTERRNLHKRVIKRAKEYKLINGVLFREISKTYPTPRRVPPIVERPLIIQKLHDELGHWGVQKTLYLVAKTYFWSGMSNDVKEYVAKCASCQKEKASFKLRTTLHPLPIARLFERVSLDLIGPLIKSRRGNEFIVVAIDAYSKYVIAAAIPNRLAQTVANFFFEQVICRISCPQIVRTDHGSEFKLEFADMCTKYGITHQMSSPHRPEANGQVERANGSIIHSIRRSMDILLTTWDDQLQTSVWGYNVTKQASTNFSPHYMLYNQEPRIGDAQDAAAMQREVSLTQALEVARSRENEATASKAVANMGIAQERQCKDYERRRPMDLQLYDTGTMVLVKTHSKGNKLGSHTEGPYRLEAYNTDHTLVQVSDAKGSTWTEHVSFITPFKDSPTPNPPSSSIGKPQSKSPSSRARTPSRKLKESQS